MTVATLMKRLAEFVETEPGSCEVVVYDSDSGKVWEVRSAEKYDSFGMITFEVGFDMERG